MLTPEEIRYLRERLLTRREELLARHQQHEADWQALGARDVEPEEEAQKTHLTSLLDQLDDRAVAELEEIDLALHRIAVGNYGHCAHCGRPLVWRRLEAMPTARLCLQCAQQFEEEGREVPRAREIITRTAPPSAYQDLSDEQLQMAIRDKLRNDGRIPLEEARVSCQEGVVYLDGRVPNTETHQILLQILTDIMGLTAIVDRLRIAELAREQRERAPGTAPSGVSAEEQLLYDVEELTENIYEAEEDTKHYNPPDRPSPESE